MSAFGTLQAPQLNLLSFRQLLRTRQPSEFLVFVVSDSRNLHGSSEFGAHTPADRILGTPASFGQESLAVRRMLEHVSHSGVRLQTLAADKAYGSGEFLAWLLERNIQPHIPVIDRPRIGG